MGIKHLLKTVDPACRKGYIREFAGKRVALDISCWIHKGFYHGDYMDYLKRIIDLLRVMRCVTIIVFDGKSPEAKSAENTRRKEVRRKSCEKAKNECIITGGDPGRVKKPMEITPEIIEEVKREFSGLKDVTILQAPGESDPQMAFLALNGHVDVVITEDSDLIVYGCEKIVFKLTPFGKCVIYERAKLHKCLPYYTSGDFPVFRWACIMSGCDYFLGGYKGTGMCKALRLLEKVCPKMPYDEAEIERIFGKMLTCDGKFIEAFKLAERTFLHQEIWDPQDNTVKPLNPVQTLQEAHRI